MVNYDGQRLCGVEDSLGAIGDACKWPLPDVTWTIQADMPGFAADSFKSAIETAFGWWQAVCGVRPKFVSLVGQANIVVGLQTIGPGGVLADSGLPCGFSMQRQLQQRYDTAEAWTIAENPPSNKIDLVRVACHELGHAIGIPHIGTGNLMAPVYSVAIRKPRSGDIVEAQARYGPAATLPPPPPPTGGAVPSDLKELCAWLQATDGRVFIRRNGETTLA